MKSMQEKLAKEKWECLQGNWLCRAEIDRNWFGVGGKKGRDKQKKITINGSNTTGFDKSKVECYNCHKMGHFAREYRRPRNQDSRNRYQDSSRRTMNVEETSSKAMVAIDGVGFDWSYLAEDEQYDDLKIEFNKSEFNLVVYKKGLTSVEEQLVFYKNNETTLYENIVVLTRDMSIKDSKINVFERELEKIKQEKEGIQLKIENFDNASKSLDKLLGSQMTNKSKNGLGFQSYNVVLPPAILVYSTRKCPPPKTDLSYSGLEEFKNPQFESYEPKFCEKESKNVSEDIPNEPKEYPDAPLVKDRVSDNKYFSIESPIMVEKKTDVPTIAKVKVVRPKQQEKPVRKTVRYAEMYRSQEIGSLKRRVKKLEKKASKKTHKLKRLYKIGSSTRVESSEDARLDETQGNDQDMFDTSIFDDEEVVAEKE
nr:hypothetical protein [Tanacetum cinerariifolium]